MAVLFLTSLMAMAAWEVETIWDDSDDDFEVVTVTVVSDDDGDGQHFFVYQLTDTSTGNRGVLYARRYEQDSDCTPPGGELYEDDCFDSPIELSDTLNNEEMEGQNYLPSASTSDGSSYLNVSAKRDPISGETDCEGIPALEEIIVNKSTGSISSPRHLIDQVNTAEVGGPDNDICDIPKHSFLIEDTTQEELHACWTVEDIVNETEQDVWCHVRDDTSSDWGTGAVAINSSSDEQDHATVAVRGNEGRAILYHDATAELVQRFEDTGESIIGAPEEDAGSSTANFPHLVEADGILHAVWQQADTLVYSRCDGTTSECEDWADADSGGLDDNAGYIPDLPGGSTEHFKPQIAVDTDGNIVDELEEGFAADDAVAVIYHCAGDSMGDWNHVVPRTPASGYQQEIGYQVLEGWSAISLDYSETGDIRVDIAFIEDDDGSPNERIGLWASASVCDDLCTGSDVCS
jgi:hypothetical protein